MRAFDVRTGKLLWTFNTIPRPGEFGNDTWENDSWAVNGNTGVWTQITVDEELGLVYLPVETPTSDFYGGHRPGNNLFAESLVCVDLKTGQRKWHFQFVHHPLWNYDMSSAAILADITVNGRAIKAVAVPGKQGVPLRVRSRHRPAGLADRGAAGAAVRRAGREDEPDAAVPDQAAGVRAQHAEGADDLIDFTPELRAQAVKQLERYKVGAVDVQPAGARQRQRHARRDQHGQRRRRHQLAGRRLRSGDSTPSSRTANNVGITAGVARRRRRPSFSDIRYVSGVAGRPFQEVLGPGDCCAADSPRAQAQCRRTRRTHRIAASAAGRRRGAAARAPAAAPAVADARRPDRRRPLDSEAAVRHDLGDQPRSRRDRLAGAARRHAGQRAQSSGAARHEHSEDRTGRHIGGIGLMVTKTLVVMGDPQVTTTPEHPRGAMLRAYDKTERQGSRRRLDGGAAERFADDLLVDGKQYIVVAISGGSYSGEYVAFTLPAR